MRDVEVRTPQGLYLGTVTKCEFEAKPHDDGIRRITRGLYFHHFKQVLAPHIPIEVTIQMTDKWRTAIDPLLPHMEKHTIGMSNEFQYAFGRVPDVPSTSLWAYIFFGSHVVFSWTGLAATAEKVWSKLSAVTEGN